MTYTGADYLYIIKAESEKEAKIILRKMFKISKK